MRCGRLAGAGSTTGPSGKSVAFCDGVVISQFFIVFQSDGRRTRARIQYRRQEDSLMRMRTCTLAAAIAATLTIAGAAAASGNRPLGPFDSHEDVGGPKIAGTAAYNAVSQEFS